MPALVLFETLKLHVFPCLLSSKKNISSSATLTVVDCAAIGGFSSWKLANCYQTLLYQEAKYISDGGDGGGGDGGDLIRFNLIRLDSILPEIFFESGDGRQRRLG